MPTRDGYPEGVPCWVDLATTDVETATAFYATLFGWRWEEPESDTAPYWMAYQKDLPVAGAGPAPEGQPFNAWTTYIAVDDADTTAERIAAAGGRLAVGPMDVLDAGRLAIASDPTGAVFGVWESGEHKGAALVNEHGSLNWNELQTDAVDEAVSFYQKVFGHGRENSEGATRPYTLLSVEGREIAGVMTPPAPDIPNSWGVYFAIDDAEWAAATAEENGASILYGPVEAEGVGIFVGISDPTGASSSLIQLANEID